MTDTGGTEQVGPNSQELVQVQLIIDTIPDVEVYPPNWQEVGAQYVYRRDRVLVRDDDLDDVRSRLGVESTVDPDFDIDGLRRLQLDVPGPGDTEWSLPDRVGEVRGDRGSLRGPTLDHLFYVCIHSCAAIEPLPTYLHHEPVPALSPSGHGAGVRVLVLDNGLVAGAAQSHQWMHGVTGESDVAGQNGTIPQDGGHGTFTAGCVRVTSPAADVRVLNAAALLPPGPRTGEIGAAFDSDIADLLRNRIEADDRPDVIVFNFAGTTQGDLEPPAMAGLAPLVRDKEGFMVFAPAGNEGQELRTWPGSFDWVVSVGGLSDGAPAADVADPSRYRSGAGVSLASWSNFGRDVDVYAPGDLVVNAYATGDYTPTWQGQPLPPVYFSGMAVWSGTSFATPLVAGMVAARKSAFPSETVRDAWHHLKHVAETQPVPGAGPALYPGQGLT